LTDDPLLLKERTTEPALTNAEFAKALRLVLVEFKAEGFVQRRKRRDRRAKHRDFLTDDTGGFLTVADAAELLGGLGD
jgi:hypothetical protein